MSSIVITGATAGIGRAAAILLAGKGHRVFALGRSPEELAALDAQHENISAITMDVTRDDSVDAAVEAIRDALGGEAPDILVNNAGCAVAGPVEAVPLRDWERQLQTNVIGLVRVTQRFLPAMRERRRGRIINVSSVAGRVTMPFFGPYNASKHAVESLSDALRHEVRPHGIEVIVIEPGAVKTRFGALEQEQLAHWIEAAPAYASELRTVKSFHQRLHAAGADPVSIAGCIVDACENVSPAPRRIVPLFPGAAFVVLKALLPTRLGDWLTRRITGLT